MKKRDKEKKTIPEILFMHIICGNGQLIGKKNKAKKKQHR